jgi:tetratricopeptide (TPR) repeat protein|tara:strand:- start:922 stop:2607 length:1686 start_codon:yes stop_codon:yes gene_type:complete
MKLYKTNFKIIGQIIFVIIFLSTSSAKSLDKFNKAEQISDYFYGILLFNENQYDESLKYFKKLNGLEISHLNYSAKYLYTLVNSGNFKEAFNYSKKLEKKNLDTYESNLISGIYYLKNSNLKLSKRYFLKAKKNSEFILNNYVSSSLYNWSSISSLNKATEELKKLNKSFENFKKIQNTFLNCYFNSTNTRNFFNELLSSQTTDFSRYNYFLASYIASTGEINEAKKIVNSALKLYPRNLLLNQYKLDLNENNNILAFDCKKRTNVAAEILYVAANALSSQSIHSLSNFYLNLAKYLNEDFHSYDALRAENFYKIDNFKKAKKIYNNLSKKGDAFQWYSSKQLARIFIKNENKREALKLLEKSYNDFTKKNIYETFDYAEFLKNNEKFKEAIPLYTQVINQVQKNHPLYAESTDGRGIAYERTGEWDKAEKDLLASLKVKPDQAYVINYLAYSWIEKGIKVAKSLNMLEKANKLRSNDPYITDSLGWALFKLERYKEAKDYLQLAVKLLPADPTVNDHYGDALWKNGNKIQARYYWNYVLKLEKIEEKLKKNIKDKLIKGL